MCALNLSLLTSSATNIEIVQNLEIYLHGLSVYLSLCSQSRDLRTSGPFIELLVLQDSESSNARPRLICFSIAVKRHG